MDVQRTPGAGEREPVCRERADRLREVGMFPGHRSARTEQRREPAGLRPDDRGQPVLLEARHARAPGGEHLPRVQEAHARSGQPLPGQADPHRRVGAEAVQRVEEIAGRHTLEDPDQHVVPVGAQHHPTVATHPLPQRRRVLLRPRLPGRADGLERARGGEAERLCQVRVLRRGRPRRQRAQEPVREGEPGGVLRAHGLPVRVRRRAARLLDPHPHRPDQPGQFGAHGLVVGAGPVQQDVPHLAVADVVGADHGLQRQPLLSPAAPELPRPPALLGRRWPPRDQPGEQPLVLQGHGLLVFGAPHHHVTRDLTADAVHDARHQGVEIVAHRAAQGGDRLAVPPG